ncbi:hypothetical protein RND81_10G174400 [Saponaria officinalis]|uniref:Transmembrane protein n=1 Tax=Saponaria officinalis TaxID=3572 RepID=A0AAW1I329_SAPOF
MDSIALRRRARMSSHGRLLAIICAILAVISPLYIDGRASREIEEEEEGTVISFAVVLPVLLLVLILGITVSCYLDQRFARFDAYWIHRVGGSSGGILFILTILLLVLKFKS